jgi:hypothetical protein|tara:strand:+ start:778 stop:1101 length:324 start_codon:yes stop_codon:yes gene_type:complete
MIEYNKKNLYDSGYSIKIHPINAGEKEIAKMFGIALTTLKKNRQEKKFTKDICFTAPKSHKILYNIEKFKKWFDDNTWIAHIDYNAEIRKIRDNINAHRKALRLPKI